MVRYIVGTRSKRYMFSSKKKAEEFAKAKRKKNKTRVYMYRSRLSKKDWRKIF